MKWEREDDDGKWFLMVSEVDYIADLWIEPRKEDWYYDLWNLWVEEDERVLTAVTLDEAKAKGIELAMNPPSFDIPTISD